MSTELEEVETRMEEYPMTKSFLHLIDVLTDGLIPNALGAGTRTPGFEPYLNFIRDSIFLRFNTRAYKNVAEKWEISTGCLRIIQKLLVDYSPLATDFNRPGHQQDLTSPVGRHPGFYIMIHLLQSSEMLRMIMFILDEGCSHIDTYLKFPGKASLEEACLLSLQILDSALSKQASFMEAARAANTSTLLTSLDQLLLGVNPRSGRADHMLNITKFVTYSWWLPRHTLHAVRVLSAVADSPSAQAGILATLNTTDQIGLQIIKGFTDVLDNEEEENLEEEVASSGRCIGAARIAIVQMLLNGLEKPAPSLSHFLLGFDLKKGVSRSTLQPPGVFGSIRTPLHAILAFLRPIGPKQPSPTLSHAPHLCESAFMLIYHLAANQQTSEPSLRYLRSTEDFLSTHLALLPLDDGGPMSVQITKGISWLLKTLAIELKLVSSARLRSQVALLIGLLLDADTASNMNNTTIADELSTTFGGETAMSQLSRSVTTTTRVGTDQFSQGQHRLILILNSIDFAEETISTPTWDVFDTNQIGQLLKSCEQSKAPGEKSIDIQKLHKILNEELANLQGAAALSQRQIIQEEIKSVLLYAVRWNSLQDQTLAKRSILDSWRQVTEVMLCSVPGDVLSASAKQQLLLDLLQTLLNKVLADNTMPELTNQVSGVVLLLIAALRQTYLSKEGSGSSGSGGSRENYVSILDAVRDRDPNRASSAPLYSTALHVILKGLVMWITSTSASAQRVRSNLYGALVNFLRIGKSSNTEDRTPSIYRSASLDLTEQAKFRKTNLEVISTYGDNFLDILCRDTVSGHDIRRMLALSVLDELVHLDGRGSWTFYMSNQGYLRHIIESMTIEDQHLVQLLSAEPDNLKALYTYESKMAMLTRLASTVTGAELLLESGLMVRLSDMTIFSSRPDIGPNPALSVAAMDVDDQTFIPSPLQRYYQILFPALRLCQALLASLGSGNRSVTAQVLHFITSNEELVRTVLKTRGIFSLSHLQELALLTGVIARCVSFETFEGAASAADLELSGYVSRIQRQMLALIPHFDLNDDVSELIKNTIPERSQADALRFVLETNANVMMFARNIAAKNSSNAKFQRVIFTPSLIEAKERGDYDGNNFEKNYIIFSIRRIIS